MLREYILVIFADGLGEIAPHRITELLEDAKKLGGDSSPLELVQPAPDYPHKWGLRMRIEADE